MQYKPLNLTCLNWSEYFLIVFSIFEDECALLFVSVGVSTRIDELEKRVQDVIGQINDNRSTDQGMMSSFQDKLSNKVPFSHAL